MKRRKDSAFGLHFDFHANPEGCPRPIGETLKEENIREICTLLRPDFLQIDCKGHPGWASYPTKLGNAMPEFCGDPLALWRRVTKEEGVALYLHYSGVLDAKYCNEHPEEACMKADGKRGTDTRTVGKYADEVVIPQLTELATKYGADGVWVDGECWGTDADFDPETLKLFEKKTGIDLGGKLPANREDPYFDEYRAFCRDNFKTYLRHYVDEVHKAAPDFQIASNWAFTDHMPEPISADVDFISGDFNPENSVNSARYAGRAIARLNATWDLMAWNFRHNGQPKHPCQIMQEAASVISLGGGFQNYICQFRDGSPNMDQIRKMKVVADFVRAREPFCFRGKSLHQVTVLLSTYDRLQESGSLYSRNGCEKIMGLTALLCDAGHVNGIATESELMGHMNEYPVIVVPELFAGLEDATVEALLSYAKAGGSLLLAGAKTCALFEEKIGSDAVSVEAVFNLNGKPATVAAYGKGKIGSIAHDLGSAYLSFAQYLHKDALNALLEKLYTPRVKIEACEGVLEINDLEKDGKEMIQLVNANGHHADPHCATEDKIQACRDIVLSVAAEKAPRALILQPAGRELPFDWNGVRARVKLERVDVHEVIEVVVE